MVLRICRLVAGSTDAEDVWSETFLAALVAYPRLRPGSNVRGWLVTIAHHKAIDRHRARARGPLPFEQVPEHPIVDVAPLEEDAELWATLAALPPKQRSSVAYHYVAGLRYKDVGELIGSSEAAARRAAADGIASMRRTLNRKVG